MRRSRPRRQSLFATAGWILFGAASPVAVQPVAAQPAPSTGQSVDAAGLASTAVSGFLPTGKVDPDGLLLFEVDLNTLTLTDGLAAYGSPEDPLIPVGELTRLLELDVDVSPTERRITGQIGQAQRSILVDIKTGVARNGSRDVTLAPEDVAVTPNEIYLRASAIQRLLPLRLKVDPSNLSITMTSTELLPVEDRLARQARMGNHGPTGPADQILNVETPYKAFTPPSFDFSLGAGVENIGTRVPFRYDIRGAGDLFHANLQTYLGSNEDGSVASVRATLERRSLTGDLLGPLKARVVSGGDVFTPALAIGPRGIAGRGVVFSTVPLDRSNVFNKIDLHGELPLGYDVELYVNDVLIAGQSAPAQGRYEFLGVQLSTGVNVVRIVSYGPRGERKTDTRVINVGAGLLEKGEATFEFGAVQQNESLIPVRTILPVLGRDIFSKGPRVVASANYGVTQYLTLAGGASTYATRPGNQQTMVTLGARTSILGLATQVDLAQNDQQGKAASVGVAGRVLGISTVIRHSEYRGGFSDESSSFTDLNRDSRRRTELSLDGSAPLMRRTIPVTLHIYRDEYNDGGNSIIGYVRASQDYAGVLYSTGLDYERTDTKSGPPTNLVAGYLAASAFKNYKWQVRGVMDYEFRPRARARDLGLTVDHNISDALAMRFGVTQDLTVDHGRNIFASVIRRTRFGDFTVTGEYDTNTSNYRLGFQLDFGLAYDPGDGRYKITRTGPGSGGSVALHAFVDTNGDGLWEPGEPGVANASLEGGGGVGSRQIFTDARGRAYVTGLGYAPTTRVIVGLERIDNPSVKAPPAIVQFMPRPGVVTIVEYPVQPTGEVLVKIQLRRADGQLVALSAVQVQLVNPKGVTLDAITEFDGSAIFEDIPLNTYQLRLAPDQAARLKMRLAKPFTITIRGDGRLTPDVAAEVIIDPR